MAESSFASDGISGTRFERHMDGVFFATSQLVIVGVNDQLVALTGYSRDELLEGELTALFDLSSHGRLRACAARALGGVVERIALTLHTKSGDSRAVTLTLIASESPRGLIGIARVAPHPPEESDSNSVNQAASRMARFSGWSIDVDTGVTTWGDQMFAILGFDEPQAPNYELTLDTFYEEPYRSIVESAVNACIADGTPIDLQIKIRDLHGVELDARILGQAQRDREGRVVRLDGAFYDITEVVRQRDEVHASQRDVAEMFHNVNVPLFVVDRKWRFQYVNRAGLELAHLSSQDVGSVSVWKLFPEVQFSEIGRICRAAMDEGRFGATVQHVDALDGDFEVVIHSMTEGIMITARNVASEYEAVRQRDEYAEHARSLAQMLDLTNDAVVVRDFDREVTYWNDAAEELYGYTFDEVRGRSPLTFLYDDTSVIEAALDEVLREGSWRGDLVHRSRDGRRIVVASRLSLLRDTSGTPTAFFGLHTDVTALRKKEEDRIRAQRMESLGTLAGGIAHDLNNVLTPMVMSMELLLSRASDERDRRLLESMNSGVTRASQMVRQVLTFARGVEGERAIVPIRSLLDQVEEFCRDVLPKSIDVIFDAASDLGEVIGDETQLMQVLVNLVTNARDAMPEGGVLMIRGRNVTSSLSSFDDSLTKRWVAISVSDTGDGMDPETQAHVFEPFFTTKEFGEGTGLGLSTSSAIVESHGGKLFLESELGRGSTFTLELPREASSLPEVSATLSPGRAWAPERAAHLLVVDDEEAIVAMVRDVLRESGYDVDAVTSGDAALALLNEGSKTYDLILSDVNMPKLSGPQLARQIQLLGVSSVIAFMSGVSDDSLVETLGDGLQWRYLQKPFTVSQLLDFVDDAVSAS